MKKCARERDKKKEKKQLRETGAQRNSETLNIRIHMQTSKNGNTKQTKQTSYTNKQEEITT